jgi:hypothetical protein
MEHKGIRYDLVQALSPRGWKWVAHLSATETKTGFSYSKQMAQFAAIRAIDKALEAKK